MPPKKSTTKAAAAIGTEDGNGAFRWTLENEKKLLILTQGRYLSGEDYERLVKVFPGTNLNGVKIKVSRFRVQQRDLYKELGWDLPEGGAKRKNSGGGGSREETPTKKARTPSKKGKKEVEEKVEEDEVESEEGVNVKKEAVEEEDEEEVVA
ncbi:hypothetical protein IQ06DRAFT_367114 [Phaeosphaeriaceae sp. SRC1lsM3a]|nr:hypothetical protein IQ06DRAFT_367114 [Stagonospora sp. SRC1lsM3a]